MRVLTEEQVAALLTPAEAFAAVEGSLLRIARGEVDNPLRLRLALPDGQFAVMPCVDRGLGYAGLKTYAWTPGGAPFLVVLFTLGGELAAVVEASTLGERRTAAASAVAASRLARHAVTLGVFGCGRQAASHVTALRDALPSIARALVHAPNADRVAAFCEAHDCEPSSPEDAGACDVVVTATTAERPVLRGEWLAPGAFVCAVGANDPGARELDDAVLERAALLCVDSLEQSQLEAGDLVEPASRGLVEWERVVELPAIVSGEAPGRAGDDDIVVFKSNGMAAWDLAAAARVLARA